ncbi:MAG: DUF4405 domain-containing protein [Thermodesulfobacteriota bacterium]
MNLRKITSMTMLIAFVLCILTTVILYIVPHGRVAYWADWRLWGLSKGQWSDLHVNLGFLFLIAGLLHVFYNWKVITAYMKNKSREMRVFTPSFNAAMVVTLIVGFGTYFHIPPMSTVLEFSESIKDAKSEVFGEPPYGHAELSSLKIFTKKMNIDLEKAKSLLEKAQITVENEKQTIGEIADANNTNPKRLYEIIKPAEAKKVGNAPFPDTPFSGFGRKKLNDICQEFGLDIDAVIKGLAKENVTAHGDDTIKEIAEGVDMDPHAFFETLHSVVTAQK